MRRKIRLEKLIKRQEVIAVIGENQLLTKLKVKHNRRNVGDTISFCGGNKFDYRTGKFKTGPHRGKPAFFLFPGPKIDAELKYQELLSRLQNTPDEKIFEMDNECRNRSGGSDFRKSWPDSYRRLERRKTDRRILGRPWEAASEEIDRLIAGLD